MKRNRSPVAWCLPLLCALSIGLAACGPTAEPPDREATDDAFDRKVARAVRRTLTAMVTDTPEVTATPEPTETVRPSPTLEPTATMPPTEVPRPTDTPAATEPPDAARILVYSDGDEEFNEQYLFEALHHLGLEPTAYASEVDFLSDLQDEGPWDLVVISQMDGDSMGGHWAEVVSALDDSGTPAIVETWNADDPGMSGFLDWCGATWESDISASQSLVWHETGHPIFTVPNQVPELEDAVDDWMDDGDELRTESGATSLAGIDRSEPSTSVITLCRDQRTLLNTFLFGEYQTDQDGDGIADAIELWMNEIAFLLEGGTAGSPGVPIEPPAALQVLAWTAYADVEEEYANMLDALERMAPSAYEVVDTSTTSADTLESLLDGAEVFLVPEQELADSGTLSDAGRSLGPVLQDFVESGGRVVITGEWGGATGFCRASGLLLADYVTDIDPGTFELVVPGSPIAEGLPIQIEAANTTGSYKVEDLDALVVAESEAGYAVVVTKALGSGDVILLGPDYYSTNTDLDRLLVNALFTARGQLSGAGQPPTVPEPVDVGPAHPPLAGAITPDNASQVVQVARWGKGLITQSAYSPDGRWWALASSLGVYLWDIETLTEVQLLQTPGAVLSTAFSPEGQTLAAGLDSGDIVVWSVPEWELLDRLPAHYDWVRAVTFSPDGRMLASASDDGTAALWDSASGEELFRLEGHTDWVRGVAISPDGTLAATCSDDATVMLWDTTDGTELFTMEGHGDYVRDVAFSPDGTLLASGGDDGAVNLWDPAEGELLASLEEHNGYVYSVEFSPDGSILASGSDDGTAIFWDPVDGTVLRTLEGHLDGVRDVSFSADGTNLASVSIEGTVRFWSVPGGQTEEVLSGYNLSPLSLAFAPTADVLAVGSMEGDVGLLSVADGRRQRTISAHDDWVRAVAFSPDGGILATGSDDRSVCLWEVDGGELRETLYGHEDWVRGVAFSPDGAIVASASDDTTARLWDVDSGELLRILEGHHTDYVRAVAFSPGGSVVATASDDETVGLWDPSDGALLRVLEGHSDYVRTVAFSPDGQLLASGGDDGIVILWDPSDGTELRVLDEHLGYVTSLAFSPDGQTLITGSADGKVILWDVATGRALRSLEASTGSVQGLAFSPDGRLIAAGYDDGSLALWGVPAR